jgi:hypothetical protein
MQVEVRYVPFGGGASVYKLVQTHESAGKPGFYYATAEGAGCSKDYNSGFTAARELVEADLGRVLEVKAF